MHTFAAERFVDDDPASVRDAIAALTSSTWGEHARTVAESAVWHRTDAIEDAWLTWEVSSGPAGTRVRVVLDELDTGPDPTAELERLLATLDDRRRRDGAAT